MKCRPMHLHSLAVTIACVSQFFGRAVHAEDETVPVNLAIQLSDNEEPADSLFQLVLQNGMGIVGFQLNLFSLTVRL